VFISHPWSAARAGEQAILWICSRVLALIRMRSQVQVLAGPPTNGSFILLSGMTRPRPGHCRPPFGRLPTRQVVDLGEPRPSVQPVTTGATLRVASSSPAVP
jgi:hypothetical protein